MITEDYCSFELSKLLKEKGFDEPCQAYWRDFENGDRVNTTFAPNENHNEVTGFTSMPTHQMAMKWLREVHNILIVISITYEKERYDWYICGIKGDPWEKKLFHEEKDVTYTTYEEAVEAAIKYYLMID